ncbi:MAG: metallophosphoesterase [Candidatus Accumulibacter sp.]|jgi:UDP-2,3-diacylglucosamine pyrophosphatase LpxH|nr:metallophosphoesterase [Accumulibacter sp.]
MTNQKHNHQWIYTYDYAPDQEWEPWRTEPMPSGWIDGECITVNERVNKIDKNGILKFALLADTHYVINGTWEDTAYSLRKTHEFVNFDGVIHLGDLTDGMLTAVKTKEFSGRVTGDMNSLGVPVYIVPGNHDYNYFKGNTEIVYPKKPRFYEDYNEQKLRLIFMDSFDPKESSRYGFCDCCIHWLDSVLSLMPQDYNAIVFSHLTPLVRLQAWVKDIRGRVSLMSILDRYADNILAFINGHNHCDLLFNDLSNGKFPIVSINCSKCECFLEHKPHGAVVPCRALGDRTQECWDVLLIDTKIRKLDFIRFGAGNDRIVRNGKAAWV